MVNGEKIDRRNKICCIINCKNSAKSNSLNTSKYHRFPKNKQLKEYWLKFTKRTDINPDTLICSDHFLENDYDRTKVIKYIIHINLKEKALPSIYLQHSKLAELTVEEQLALEEDNRLYLNKIFDECFPNQPDETFHSNEDMAAHCVVVNCISTNKEVTLFSFPKNEHLKDQWIKAVPFKREITEDARVCENHFLPSDIIWSQMNTNSDGTEMFYEFGRPQIKHGAIPRILPTIIDVNQPDEDLEEKSQKIESINFETESMPLPPLKRKSNSSGIEAKRKQSMENEPISFFPDETYSSTGTLNTSSSNKIHTNIDKSLDKEAHFRENLQDFGNFIISTLNGIYDEAIMLNAQQEISMVCFEAKSKWIAKKKSIYG